MVQKNRGRKYLIGAAAALLVVLSLSVPAFAISMPLPQGTFPAAINKRGEVAGHCLDSIGVAHGFVRDAQGRITVFEAPGAGSRQREGTFVTDINNAGTIVGYYLDSSAVHHGFVREPNGAFTVLDAPGAGAGMGPPSMGHPELMTRQGTVASGLNDQGTIVGYFMDAKNVHHGFFFNNRGIFIAFDVPGSGGTSPQSINNSGEITGTYNDPPRVPDNGRDRRFWPGPSHGFLRDANGKFTDCDLPSDDASEPQTVDDSGTIVGSYSLNRNGFVRDAGGTFAMFGVVKRHIHPSDSTSEVEISACYLGAKGEIQVGTLNEDGTSSVSNSAKLGPGRYRGIACANVTESAALVGYYVDGNRTYHGFITDEHGAVATFDAPAEGSVITITSVSPLVAGATDAITIKGHRFGSYQPATTPGEVRFIISDSGSGRGCGKISHLAVAIPSRCEWRAGRSPRLSWSDSPGLLRGDAPLPQGTRLRSVSGTPRRERAPLSSS